MIDVIQQQLNSMRAQESTLEEEIKRLNDQLLMTRGARQMLEHVIDLALLEASQEEQENNDHEHS